MSQLIPAAGPALGNKAARVRSPCPAVEARALIDMWVAPAMTAGAPGAIGRALPVDAGAADRGPLRFRHVTGTVRQASVRRITRSVGDCLDPVRLPCCPRAAEGRRGCCNLHGQHLRAMVAGAIAIAGPRGTFRLLRQSHGHRLRRCTPPRHRRHFPRRRRACHLDRPMWHGVSRVAPH